MVKTTETSEIKVHILNFHGIFSHIEIVLEDTTTDPHSYYGVNRWEQPRDAWQAIPDEDRFTYPKGNIHAASSVYTFTINGNPEEIKKRWQTYWHSTSHSASILGNNCAVAAQWFLTEFAEVPKPNFSNFSMNHLILGLFWPSIIPCPVTLPGRIFAHAKFYIEARTNEQAAKQHSRLFLHSWLALMTLTLAATTFALVLAATILSAGMAGIVITAAVATGLAATCGFFKGQNLLSAKNIYEQTHGINQPEVRDPELDSSLALA